MKKFTLFIFTLIIGLSIFCGLNVRADAIVLTMVNGAQVRTTGDYQGLRFEASVDTLEGASEHGFYIALGEHSLSDMRTAIEADSATVGGYKLVNKQALGEDTTFALTIYDITEEYYTSGITAVAYVKVGADYILDKAVTKNIAEVTMSALNAGETAPLLTTVKEYISSNYKKAYENYAGNFVINNAAYCYIPTELSEVFISDWNKFVDEEDRISSITSNTKATAASLSYKGRSGADFYYSAKGAKWTDVNGGKESIVTDISTSNLYLFFNDAAMQAKWGWLLDLLVAADTTVHTKRQIDAIKGTGINDLGLYNGVHLIGSIINFFNETGVNFYYTSINFSNTSGNKRAFYEGMLSGSYANTTVYNFNFAGHEIVEIGDSISLPAAKSPAAGYLWDAYYLDTNDYASESSYQVTSSNVTFVPTFSLINYDINYELDGGVNNISNPETYDVETAVTLYEPTKLGFAFGGWYDNPEFTGSPITSINVGSTGTVNLYAKFILTNAYVNASWTTYSNNEIFEFNEQEYVYGVDAFSRIGDAVGKAATINVYPGTYSDSFTISSNGTTLIGPNNNISAVDGIRNEEAIITGRITLNPGLSNISIYGFKFTGAGQVYATSPDSGSSTHNISGFNYKYNYVDKGTNTTAAVVFADGNRQYSDDIVIEYCYFTAPNLTEVVSGKSGIVYTNNNVNITVKNCKFYNIPLNAVGCYDTTNGKGAAGDIIFENNTFIDITKGAIWMQYNSPLSGTSHIIRIKGNYLENVNGAAAIDFEGANTSDVYASARVEENVFKDVFKCLWVDKIKGVVFTNNAIYEHSTPASAYVVKGVSGYNINCAGNLYIRSNGSVVTTVYSTNGSTGFAFNAIAINTNIDNYTSKEAYNEAGLTYTID